MAELFGIYNESDLLKGAVVQRVTFSRPVNVSNNEIVFVFDKATAEAFLEIAEECYSIWPKTGDFKPLIELIVEKWPDLREDYSYLVSNIRR